MRNHQVVLPNTATASSISSIVDIPVEMIRGRPVCFILRNKTWSVSEAEAAL